MDYNLEIDKFVDSFTSACLVMDFRTFGNTVSWDRYDPLIANSWTRRVLQMIADCKRSELNYKEIAKLFHNPSELRCKFGFDLWMAKYASVSKDDRLKISKFYIDLLNAYCLDDPYAFSKNIIHTRKEIRELLDKTSQASSAIAKQLGRLVNACYHLGHALYSDMYPSIVYENYGSYTVDDMYGDGCIVAIKDFCNLKCPELWPETKNFNWNQIRIVNLYQDVKMKIDSATHTVYNGDLINNLIRYSLVVDNQVFSLENINKLRKGIEELAVNIFSKFQSFNIEQKKEKYYFQKAYAYKNIYDKLGQDWRPSEEILQEARDKDLYQLPWPSNKQKLTNLFKEILDPRKELPNVLPKLDR